MSKSGSEDKAMGLVTWRGVTLGEGIPKVCVSITGKTVQQMVFGAMRAEEAGAQILELRMDSLCAAPDAQAAIDACVSVRSATALPLLFTLRTARDGGAGAPEQAAYEALLCAVAKARVCDAVDVELSVGEAAFVRIVQCAHTHGVSVVGSSHEFGELADVHQAGAWLTRQRALGADICKAAVMPKSRAQAYALMATMAEAGEALDAPMIAIVMGPYGAATRVCAQTMGSCLTFGAVGTPSAPGQIEAGALRNMLAVLAGGEMVDKSQKRFTR